MPEKPEFKARLEFLLELTRKPLSEARINDDTARLKATGAFFNRGLP
jgi:hypothetical protein